jgi:hypothetical protein
MATLPFHSEDDLELGEDDARVHRLMQEAARGPHLKAHMELYYRVSTTGRALPKHS